MPRISASEDDTVVGQTVPSTTVDPSSGTGTTLSASSSNVNTAGVKHPLIREDLNVIQTSVPGG